MANKTNLKKKKDCHQITRRTPLLLGDICLCPFIDVYQQEWME